MKKNTKYKNNTAPPKPKYTHIFPDGLTVTLGPNAIKKIGDGNELLKKVKNLHEFLGRPAK